MSEVLQLSLIKSHEDRQPLTSMISQISKKNPYEEEHYSKKVRQIIMHPYTIKNTNSNGTVGFSTPSLFVIKTHTGLLDFSQCMYYIKYNAFTSANTTLCEDGYPLLGIKELRLSNAQGRFLKLNPQSIYMLFSMFGSDYLTKMKSLMKIGTTHDESESASQNTSYIPLNFLQMFCGDNALRTRQLSDELHVEVELDSIATIAYDSSSATVSSSVNESYLYTKYIRMLSHDMNNISLDDYLAPYVDYQTSTLEASSTSQSIRLNYTGNCEFILLMITDNVTHTKFNGVVLTYYPRVQIDNTYYPEIADLPIELNEIDQINFFGRPLGSNIYLLPFSSYFSGKSSDDITKNFAKHEQNGAFIVGRSSNPTLNLTHSALSNASTLHILYYGRAHYVYKNGSLVVNHQH